MELRFLSTEQALYIFAAILTIAMPMFTAVFYSLKKTRDPFLIFYVLVAIALTAIFWIFIRMNTGAEQLRAVLLLFGFVATMTLFVVFWRYLAVKSYVESKDEARKPLGFFHGNSDFKPYFLLISAWILLMLWLILYYTVDETNINNRFSILAYFLGLLLFMGIMRLAWQQVENWGYREIAALMPKSEKRLQGVLRAIDLDNGFLELSYGEDRTCVHGLEEKYGDKIGDLLNRRVIIIAMVDEQGTQTFKSIQRG
jgi:hypothetical protein